MSSGNTPSAYLLASLTDDNVNTCVLIVTAVIVFYDSLLTLSEEARFMWQAKQARSTNASLVKVVFYANKAVGVVYVFAAIMYATYDACSLGSFSWKYIYISLMVALVLMTAIWAAFTALRLCAISHNVWLTAFAVILALVTPVCNAWEVSNMMRRSYIVSWGPLCTMPIAYIGMEISEMVLSLVHACGIVSDLIVIGVIWRTTYSTVRHARSLKMNASITTVILRDGALYFLISLLMNVVILICTFLGPAINIPYLLYSLQCILIPRFFINLRGTIQPHDDRSETNMAEILESTLDARGPSGDLVRYRTTDLINESQGQESADDIIEISRTV